MFYERAKAMCEAKGVSLSYAVKAVEGSTGSIDGWKKGRPPMSDIVVRLAKYLNTSSDYLLGLSNEPALTDETTRNLSSKEIQLIDDLRLVPNSIYDIVFTMTHVAIASQIGSTVFSSPKGKQVTHEEKPDHVLAANPKLRSLGVGKGASAVAWRRVEGKAAAGTPRAAVREDDRQIVVPVKYTGEQYFIVQAEGDSMTGIVSDGDFCVFDKHGHFDNGRVCLVQADGATDEPDAMIKRVFRRGDRVELRSENRKYQPRFYPVEEVVLMGELVKVLPPEACMPSAR